jgi:hypothetical protein
MNCKQAKTQVALLIGNDLEPAALAEVRNHLGQCAGCRQHFERLASCLEVLQAPPRAYNAEEVSLWPKLSARLASPNAGQKPHRLNGWAPTLVVAAACTAMVWVASNRWIGGSGVDQSLPGGTIQPIANPPRVEPTQSPLPKGTDGPLNDPRHNRSHDQSGILPLREQSPEFVPVSESPH